MEKSFTVYFRLYGMVKDSRVRTGAWQTMLEKMIPKGAFKESHDKAISAEDWRLSVYNTTSDIIRLRSSGTEEI